MGRKRGEVRVMSWVQSSRGEMDESGDYCSVSGHRSSLPRRVSSRFLETKKKERFFFFVMFSLIIDCQWDLLEFTISWSMGGHTRFGENCKYGKLRQ